MCPREKRKERGKRKKPQTGSRGGKGGTVPPYMGQNIPRLLFARTEKKKKERVRDPRKKKKKKEGKETTSRSGKNRGQCAAFRGGKKKKRTKKKKEKKTSQNVLSHGFYPGRDGVHLRRKKRRRKNSASKIPAGLHALEEGKRARKILSYFRMKGGEVGTRCSNKTPQPEEKGKMKSGVESNVKKKRERGGGEFRRRNQNPIA